MNAALPAIVHVTSEMAPLVKVGGLADVVGALAFEQARRGHRVLVALPLYADIAVPSEWTRSPLDPCVVPWGLRRELARLELCEPPGEGPRVLLVGHEGEPSFFDRPGVYDDPRTGEGYSDNGERFLFFCRAAVEGLKSLHERFDIIHAHDHQAAWVPCFVRTHELYELAFGGSATIFTIHNLGYQGIHDPWLLGLAGFGRELFFPQSPFEFWGRVNYMKVGLAFADLLSTVSPRYAVEIQENGEFGFGLEGVLSRRSADLRGILNGIDDQVWNPATDCSIPARYDAERLDGKLENRRALMTRCGFPPDERWPLVGMVSRLVEQKGFDLIEQAQADLLRLEARFVVLGTGQPRYEELVRRLTAERPDRFHACVENDEAMAHLIEAGSDIFLMPSRYEPCGLNQMYSVRYGTPPVVRAVGGLADTVAEFDPLKRAGTGFLFQRFEAAEMLGSLRRALAFQRQKELWRILQRNGMSRDFSWRKSADGYEALYAEAIERVAGGQMITLEDVRERI
jgi:starch synthase